MSMPENIDTRRTLLHVQTINNYSRGSVLRRSAVAAMPDPVGHAGPRYQGLPLRGWAGIGALCACQARRR